MRILHVSDSHGKLPQLQGGFNLCLHTGDMFPNSHHIFQGNRVREAEFQLRWLEDYVQELKNNLQGRPYFFVLGNHDFVHPQLMAQFLNSEDIQAFDLTDQVVSYEGISFYGFPYIPYIQGRWNYERRIPEMQQEARRMVDAFNENKIDILACHAPIHGCLDLNLDKEHIGSTVIADALDYKINNYMLPKIICHGHLHENNGLSLRSGILIVNSATTQNIIEI